MGDICKKGEAKEKKKIVRSMQTKEKNMARDLISPPAASAYHCFLLLDQT